MRYTDSPIFLILCILLLLASVATASAVTRYEGETTLWQDTVWSGDVIVDGILTVAPEATLEIRPGASVQFTFFDSNGDGIGEHELFIQGRLQAVGTSEAPIQFSSLDRTEPGSWGAINMMVSNDGNLLSFCQIQHAYRGFHAHFSTVTISDSSFRNNMRGVQFQESTIDIARSTIKNNFNGIQFRDSAVSIVDSEIADNMWGVRCLLSTLELTGSVIERNRVNGVNLRDTDFTLRGNMVAGNRRGIYIQRSEGELLDTHVLDNREHGIFLEDSIVRMNRNSISGNLRSGIKVVHSDATVVDNLFSNYGANVIVLEHDENVNVVNNSFERMTDLESYLLDGNDRAGNGLIITGVAK